MILDKISRLADYGDRIPGADKIAKAFATDAPMQAGVEVREKAYATKADENRRFEVHFKTIDLMMARSGGEVIHICPLEATEPAEMLPNGADGQKRNGAPCGSAVDLEAGYFCAIFPGEAHMVGGKVENKEGSVQKWVVKVPALQEDWVNT